MKMRFIGDVHGKIIQYLSVRGDGPSFQIGDMAIGFPNIILPTSNGIHKFIRGNHDSPNSCRKHQDYAGDYGFWPESNLFFLGGAYSIDFAIRQQWEKANGIKTWWRDEELWQPELDDAYRLYVTSKPRIVVTHDCPTSVSVELLGHLAIGFRPEKKIVTRTGEALQKMFDVHHPEMWIFGHYHIDKEFEMRGARRGTRFVCLNELQCKDVEL